MKLQIKKIPTIVIIMLVIFLSSFDSTFEMFDFPVSSAIVAFIFFICNKKVLLKKYVGPNSRVLLSSPSFIMSNNLSHENINTFILSTRQTSILDDLRNRAEVDFPKLAVHVRKQQYLALDNNTIR